jgi:hypothetical protein
MNTSNARRSTTRFTPASCLAFAALALASSSAFGFNVYTVGTGLGCKYSNIQDAINAAAASPGEDYVWISQSASYSHQAITINGQDVIVEGGFAHCTDNQPAPGARTALSGTNGHSVFHITGNSNVTLQGLELSGGSPSDRGGGIAFSGHGSLSASQLWVHSNRASYGGGIDMNPSGASTLTLVNSVVAQNTATVQGGGIRVEGRSTLITDSKSYISENKAQGNGDVGYGGGIEIVGPAKAEVSSTVWLNQAAYGGGIAVRGHDNDSASLSLYTTDVAHPVSVYGNTASHTGGGIFLKGDTKVAGIGATAYLWAQDFSIDGNIAANGAAIYGDEVNSSLLPGPGSYHGVHVYLNKGSQSTRLKPVACKVGPKCDEIADNLSQDSNGKATGGATVLIQSDGELYANRFAARRNHGGSLFQFVDDQDQTPPSALHDCLLADNVETAPLILVTGGAKASQLIVDTCTITNNRVDTASVPAYTIGADVNFLELTNSIVYDLGAQIVDFHGRPAGDLTARYDLVNNSSTLPNGLGILKGAPTFVDVAHQDYHLTSASLGVDYAPGASGVDLDNHPRTVDLANVSNVFGPMDLGAYEIPLRRFLPPLPVHPVRVR